MSSSPSTPGHGRLRAVSFALAVVAAVAFGWWVDSDPPAPWVDRRVETSAARRARLDALLDRLVHLDAQDEPQEELLARLCREAGVPARVLSGSPGATLGNEGPRTVHLPYPVRLRSALRLAAPYGSWAFEGDELLVAPHPGIEPPRRLSIHGLPFPQSRLEPLTIVLGGQVAIDGLGWMGSALAMPVAADVNRDPRLSQPRWLAICGQHVPADDAGDLLAALAGIADRQIDGPVHLGETAAGGAIRAQLEAALATTIELDLTSAPLSEVIAQVQKQLGVNLYFEEELAREFNVDTQTRVSWHGRLPASAALRFLLAPRDLAASIQDDVVRVKSIHGADATRVYPLERLLRADPHLEQFEGVLDPLPDRLFLKRLLGEPEINLQGGVLALHQTSDVHRRLARLLEVFDQAGAPARVLTGAGDSLPAVGASWAAGWQRPARPIPGPLTLEELSDRLGQQLGVSVLIDETELEHGRLISIVHPRTAETDSRELRRIALAGDGGTGTVAEQVDRMLQAVGCAYYLDDRGLAITALESDDDAPLAEFHPLPAGWPDPLLAESIPGPSHPSLPPWLDGIVRMALSEAAEPNRNSLRTPQGVLLSAPHSVHLLLRRLLAAGHPFRETLAAYLQGPRAKRTALIRQALISDDPYVVALGVWLANDRPGLGPARLAALRAGLVCGPEFQERPENGRQPVDGPDR